MRAVTQPGKAGTVELDGPGQFSVNSDDVTIESVADPGGTGRGEVVHVTSGGTTTEDYAISLVNLRKEQLSIGDLETLRYDYYVPSGANTVGGRTDVGPDEVWIIATTAGMDVPAPIRPGRLELFRTLNDPVTPDQWQTRTVSDEFSGLSGSPWKELDEQNRTFSVVGDLRPQFDDAKVLGIGIGRGDPVTGPSKLDIYYDQLVVNGSTYAFPTGGRSRGKGKGQGPPG